MREEMLRKRLAGISQEEIESCVKQMDKFSDLAWEIAFRLAEDDLNNAMFKECHVEPGECGGRHISVWPCTPDRFLMVRDRGAQVSLTYRKSMLVPADWEELYGNSPYMDWGLFSDADEAMRAHGNESLWNARCGWGAGRGEDVEPIKLLAPNAGKRATPEEMLTNLFWTRYWKGDSARLLLVLPGQLWSDVTTVLDDTDLSPWQDKWSAVENGWSRQVFKAPLPPEDWKPSENSVADLKGMMDGGWIPVGIISDYDPHHHLVPPCHVSGYLPDQQTQWILYAFVLGYRAAEDRRREETKKNARPA